MFRSKTLRAAFVLLGVGVLLLAADVIFARLPGHASDGVDGGSIGNGKLTVGTLLDRQVPDFELVDERGHSTSLKSFRGRYLVLAPSMTLCHEVCPMTTAALERIQRTIDRDGLGGDATVAEVSVDPWRDTPRRLRAYARLAGVNFRMLTGSRAELARLWRYFGVYFRRVPQGRSPDTDWLTGKPETFDVEHTDGLFIIDPHGNWRVAAIGMPAVGGRLPARLERLLSDEGRNNLRHPQAPWTPHQALADLFTLKANDDASAPPPGAPAQSRSTGPAGTLLGGGAAAFRRRLAGLRGHPVVVNEWASWCLPCRGEFPLFAQASSNFGKRVSFLGVDVSDSASAARDFLRAHALPYPSFSDSSGAVAASFGNAQALPTTIFFTPDGRRAYTHIGAYAAPEALASDIRSYALRE
ncbi:MAG TPA: redoxin domain-containing protein [Thermoleophilaceae bacterium]|jgi:cytochrome oxidase Cu insertion factor (SCO1/SenC/PrrC family)/thiol-disulfide isomerase/thioredoxin